MILFRLVNTYLGCKNSLGEEAIANISNCLAIGKRCNLQEGAIPRLAFDLDVVEHAAHQRGVQRKDQISNPVF